MTTILFVIVGVAVLVGLGAMIFSDKSDPAERAKEGAAAAAGGAMATVGCLIQCVFAAIPVVIGLLIIGAVGRSCS